MSPFLKPRWVLILLLVALFACALPPSATAASDGQPGSEELAFMEIEEVYSAAKHWQEIKDAPASVTVVTRDEIKKYGYRNLSDILTNVRGFYITNDRKYEQLGFRGITHQGGDGNILLELVDGHTYNENMYGSVFLGNEFGIDIDLIRRVEVVRGPGSALFGSNALLGIVNVITKNGQDINGLYLKSESGSYSTYKGGFIYGNKFSNGIDIICSATLLDSAGRDFYFKEFNTSNTLNGNARSMDGEGVWNAFLKAAYGELNLTANIHARDKDVPTAAYNTTFGDNRFQISDQRGFIEMKWDHSIDDSTGMMLKAYYDQYLYTGRYPMDDDLSVLNKDETLSRRLGTEFKISRSIGSSNLMTAGAEVSSYFTAEQKNYNVDPWDSRFDQNHPYNTWSGYLQDEWRPLSWLKLVAGARYDYFTTFGGQVSPRVGIILQPTRDNTVKLIYGEAFRCPNLYELYYDDGRTQRANPDLKPESLNSYEFVWEHEFTTVWKGSVGAFHYEINDLITSVAMEDGEHFQYQNISSVTSNGVEAELSANWPGVLRGSLSYSYQDAVDDATGRWLANSPRHLVKSSITLPVYSDKLFFGIMCRYMSRRQTRDGEDLGDNVVADASLFARNFLKDMKGLEVSFQVFNLFDERYCDPVGVEHVQQSIEQNGRNFWIKVSYHF